MLFFFPLFLFAEERALREKSGLAPLPVEEPSAAYMSDDEDDYKLGDPVVDTKSEKLSQFVDNPSDNLAAPFCRLKSELHHGKDQAKGIAGTKQTEEGPTQIGPTTIISYIVLGALVVSSVYAAYKYWLSKRPAGAEGVDGN